MFGYKYDLLSPHNVANKDIPLYNKAYESWKKSFTKVLVDDAGGQLDPDDFFRCDYMGLITHQGEIVGHSLLTQFDLRLKSSLEHHYIKALTADTVQRLASENIHKLISVEYLNVLPEWRKKQSDVLWAEVLIGLALKMMDRSDADVVLGMPRIDIKVNSVCHNLEAYDIQEPVQKMNYPCAVLIFDKQTHRHFKNSTTEQYVQGLWKPYELSALTPFQLPKAA